LTTSILTDKQLDVVKRMVNGIEMYALEEDSKVFVLDHIDSLEDALAQEDISYTEDQKKEMVNLIQKELEDSYGYENVYYGSAEQYIPVDGQIKTFHAQLAVHLTDK